MIDKPEPTKEQVNHTSERLYADAVPTSSAGAQNHRAEEPNQLVFDNAPYHTNPSDTHQKTVAPDTGHSVMVQRDGFGGVSSVDFDHRTLVDFDPKTGKPEDVFTISNQPGVLSILTQLDPKTGKPADVRITSDLGVESYFRIDPLTGKATPEQSMKH